MRKSEGLFKAAHACIHKFTAKELVVPEKTLHGPTRRTSSLASNAKPREGPRVRPFSLASANNRPRGSPTVRSADRGPRSREGKRERRRGARRHTCLCGTRLGGRTTKSGGPHALFHVSLSPTTCAVTWLLGPVPFGSWPLGPHRPPNGLVSGSVIGS